MEKTFIQIGKNRIFKKNCFRLLISNVLFCFALLFSVISCSNITKNQDYATVSVSLLNINAKTISPVPANSYESVNSWTITFCDDTAELDDLIFNNISFGSIIFFVWLNKIGIKACIIDFAIKLNRQNPYEYLYQNSKYNSIIQQHRKQNCQNYFW